MKIQQYDAVKLKDGREGAVVEILGDDKEFMVDVGDSPADVETISVSKEEIAQIISC